jgi:hypothetical protein
MKIRYFYIGIGIAAGLCILSANSFTTVQAAGQDKKPAAAASEPTKAECLGCHGPFDKLIESTGDYVAPSGEKTSPHRYVPHDSKSEDDIPECTSCHTPHSLDNLPEKGSLDKSKVDVKYCYDTCHHEKNFTSCKQCHP